MRDQWGFPPPKGKHHQKRDGDRGLRIEVKRADGKQKEVVSKEEQDSPAQRTAWESSRSASQGTGEEEKRQPRSRCALTEEKRERRGQGIKELEPTSLALKRRRSP